MLNWVLAKVVGGHNERFLKGMGPVVQRINALEPALRGLDAAALRGKTEALRRTVQEALARALADDPTPETLDAEDALKAWRRRQRAAERGVLDEALPEAFALVREASRRTTGMRHFDVQLLGGMVLHQGKIAEMATGEGKTLVATLPVVLNALAGRGVHVVTVNDYLARRDRQWMGPIYELLGLTVGAIQHDMSDAQRQRAYACDITYGTNNELGFDYLRDHMKYRLDDMVQQRGFHYAIVDEVDSILVDEARTPLIISGPAEESTELYYTIDRIIPQLAKETDYQVDEKAHAASLTEQGVHHAERLLGVENLYDDQHMALVHHVSQALRAHTLYRRDVEYMIKDGEVVIVDEFTGRLMPGRRWSDGLHQAVEAKEGVKIERENQTLATITFQNFFRMYDKLAGMTGTASTEASEFEEIYKLEVVSVPTNRPLIRVNHPDQVYRTQQEKFAAVVEEIAALHAKGQPVLVGTISIEKSERLSDLLKRRQIPHQVLNAKYHELEAAIVAQAGRHRGVTIATNMAGRGTDILLGGNAQFLLAQELLRRELDPETADPAVKQTVLAQLTKQVEEEHATVVAVGGLHVLGTERHESRRIDNQLRGRSGRQGDPGSSRFYLSLEDDLMRIFGSDRVAAIMQRLGMQEGEVIEHPIVSKSIEIAQKRVELQNFEIRKQLLKYDDVMNRQREVIYAERRRVLEGRRLKERVFEILDELLDDAVALYAGEAIPPEEWDLKAMRESLGSSWGLDVGALDDVATRDDLRERLTARVRAAYETKEQAVGAGMMRQIEQTVLLQTIDAKWKDHLYAMDHLREGIHLRAYGQSDPLVEYQHEAYRMFTEMVAAVKGEAIEFIFRLQAVRAEPAPRVFNPQQFLHPAPTRPTVTAQESLRPAAEGRQPSPPPPGPPAPLRRDAPKIGRNDPCPCGSGKKYKKCHGK
ncbi:MAG: preprotein translocase subunit SecA [Omnitrophica WOR_2 bacterium RIFCSPHIGHO2_02_FULL_68_15]|nr:MAG: preprotein translocase subunit SecA [Omnitrophica WOR_2 bacterium RIFCSPHIGHO2_02_FULL_68_15]